MPSTDIPKKLKRDIYGKPQTVILTFPAGFQDVALREVQGILSDRWMPDQSGGQVVAGKKAIQLSDVHLFSAIEVMLRAQSLTDVRLVIYDGKVMNMTKMAAVLGEIPWDYYLAESAGVKLKVKIGGSPSLHEGAIEDLLIACLENRVEDSLGIPIYIDVYKHMMVISVSLAGESLYKRGYRSEVTHHAPLREDIAASCLLKTLQFAQDQIGTYPVGSLCVPFSGTGTFLFEYLIHHLKLAPVLFGRSYALQSMPLYREEHFQFLLKKAKEKVQPDQSGHYYCIDQSAEANAALKANLDQFEWPLPPVDQWLLQENVMTLDFAKILREPIGNVLILLNPPYGVRLNQQSDTINLYKQIAKQLNQLITLLKTHHHHLLGCILCPDEETWSQFCRALTGAKLETYHMTQGGLDIRVVQFLA